MGQQPAAGGSETPVRRVADAGSTDDQQRGSQLRRDIPQDLLGVSVTHGGMHGDTGMPFGVRCQRCCQVGELFAVGLVVVDSKMEGAAETLHRTAVPDVDGHE